MQLFVKFRALLTWSGLRCSEALPQVMKMTLKMKEIILNILKFTKSQTHCKSKFPKHLKINIEGNIGAGKSTVIKHLQKQYPKMKIIPEAIHRWEHILNLTQDQPGKGW